jgi:hypothetical protein
MADKPRDTPELPESLAPFDDLYRDEARQAILTIAEGERVAGASAEAQAQRYSEKGKPDFVLAYLLGSAIPDERKRELYAAAHEQRALYIEQRAHEFDRRFHRPFPLLATEAANDRVMARRIRAGMPPGKGRGRQIPLI